MRNKNSYGNFEIPILEFICLLSEVVTFHSLDGECLS